MIYPPALPTLAAAVARLSPGRMLVPGGARASTPLKRARSIHWYLLPHPPACGGFRLSPFRARASGTLAQVGGVADQATPSGWLMTLVVGASGRL